MFAACPTLRLEKAHGRLPVLYSAEFGPVKAHRFPLAFPAASSSSKALGDIRATVMGDMAGLVMLRLITPPGSMDNTLFIDGKLRSFNPGAKQEIVIIAVHEQRVAMAYAPPQELPISTVKTAVI